MLENWLAFRFSYNQLNNLFVAFSAKNHVFVCAEFFVAMNLAIATHTYIFLIYLCRLCKNRSRYSHFCCPKRFCVFANKLFLFRFPDSSQAAYIYVYVWVRFFLFISYSLFCSIFLFLFHFFFYSYRLLLFLFIFFIVHEIMLPRFALAMCVVVCGNGDTLQRVSFVTNSRKAAVTATAIATHTHTKTAVNEKRKKEKSALRLCVVLCVFGHNESSDVNDLMNKMRFIVVVTRLQ